MTALLHTTENASEVTTDVKNARIQALLQFFNDHKAKASLMGDRGLWLMEAGYWKAATEAAEVIFHLLGLNNGHEAEQGSGSMDQRQTSQTDDGTESDNDLRGPL